MKRNWDTIREILLKLEELNPETSETGAITLRDFPPDKASEYSYHIQLLVEADIIHGHISETVGVRIKDVIAYRLTWKGQELLDAIHSDNIWNKTKKSFVKGGLSMTYELVKGVATDIAASLLKSTISS
jgi:hypothetical protein